MVKAILVIHYYELSNEDEFLTEDLTQGIQERDFNRNKRKAGCKTGFGQPVAQSVNLGKGQSQKSKNTGLPPKKDKGNAKTVNISLNLLTSFVF